MSYGAGDPLQIIDATVKWLQNDHNLMVKQFDNSYKEKDVVVKHGLQIPIHHQPELFLTL